MRTKLSILVFVCASLALVGCDSEDVRTYKAPRDDDPGTGDFRVRAAIIPLDEETWFIKLTARKDIVELVEPPFEQLLASLTFAAKPKEEKKDFQSMAWKVPTGWKEDRSKPNRVATLTPDGVGKPEITITKLSTGAAAIKPNVDRWRRLDLGLAPISVRALEKVISDKTVAGRPITLVDMRGPGRAVAATSPHGGMGEGMGQVDKRPVRKAPFKYSLPNGWREAPSRSTISVLSLAVVDGNDKAQILVTPLRGAMPGGMLGNVNRWRQEVGLPALKAEELKPVEERMSPISVAGTDAKLIDLTGQSDRSLVVFFERKGTSWFFKMLGPNKLVGSQRGNFEQFVKSVQFTGGADE